MLLTHSTLLSQCSDAKRFICQGVIEVVSGGFWDDVSWTVYQCTECGKKIATVGGGLHWWNYELSPESAERLEV